MNWSDLNLMPAMPEIVLLALLGVVLLADLWICDKNRYLTHLMSLGTVIVVAVTQLQYGSRAVCLHLMECILQTACPVWRS